MNKAIDVNGTGTRARAAVLQAPNLLTIARIAAVPPIVALMLLDGPAPRWAALVLFVAAAVTDYLDGYLARRWSQRSALGVVLDPIADKLLIAAVLIMLAGDGTIAGPSLVAAVVILAREILVSGLREYLAGLDVSLPVSRLAKWKTAIQLVAVAILIAGEPGEAVAPGVLAIGTALLWLAALLTVASGYDYMKAGIARVIAEDE